MTNYYYSSKCIGLLFIAILAVSAPGITHTYGKADLSKSEKLDRISTAILCMKKQHPELGHDVLNEVAIAMKKQLSRRSAKSDSLRFLTKNPHNFEILSPDNFNFITRDPNNFMIEYNYLDDGV